MKVKFFFAWYDMWIGVYVSKDNLYVSEEGVFVPRTEVYICPLPCCVFKIWRAR